MLIRMNDPDDLEVVVPEPVLWYPGFFYFPHDRRLGVSKDGLALNIKTGSVLKGNNNSSNKKPSVLVHVSEPGKKTVAYSMHRLVALTFIGRPSRHMDKDRSRLEVNHIDGVRSNNHYLNLEWVTGNENVEHAYKASLVTKVSAVLALCLRTGKTTTFQTISRCARAFNVHKATFYKHLVSGNSGKRSKNGHVFKLDDGSNWEISPIAGLMELDKGTSARRVLVADKKNNKTYVVSSISLSEVVFNLGRNFLFRELNKKTFVEVGNLIFSIFDPVTDKLGDFEFIERQ